MAESHAKKHPKSLQRVHYKPGDYVLLRNEARTKWQSKWIGPFIIRESYPEFDAYQLEFPNESPTHRQLYPHRVHADRLYRVVLHKDNVPTELWHWEPEKNAQPGMTEPYRGEPLYEADHP
ncbi:hypothetical protein CAUPRSCDRAFT_13167 [Caulochytrium protostelioides]|uniref:Murine leukemia virus integrase C-terminal domain-containing protein n=1 Tax=Caulochytrium protostelioides TaxID=1555241 RepID=A0A4V1ISX4_9FUNG|nr:hypothetical protein CAUPRSCDRAFT_13167 [Caulochytrium protostelioides]